MKKCTRIKSSKNYIFSVARQFLITAATELRKRYNFDDKLLEALSIFHYKSCCKVELRKKIPSLVLSISNVPRI
jgi:hypothetical protein